jgi:subtilisin family serine protease
MSQGCKQFISIAIGTFVFVRSAFAVSPSQNDLIVRMKSPVHNSTMSKLLNALPTGAPKMRIINKREGLVQFRFSNSMEASIAKKILVGSGAVHSAVPNFLYHPEVLYRSVPTAHATARANNLFSKYTDPLNDLIQKMVFGHSNHFSLIPGYGDNGGTAWSSADLPAVNLPPTSVDTGDDPLAEQDLSLAQIDMPSVDQVNDYQTDTVPVIVALIDTGVDYNHEDLSGAMWRSPVNPEIVGYDFAHRNTLPFDVRHFDMDGCLKNPSCYLGIDSGNAGDPDDTDSKKASNPYLTNPGHGTHCAGHIGAVANNSLGIRGAGGNVQIMALKFVHDVGEVDAGEGDDVAAIQSIDYAIKNGARVINASWGNRELRSDAEKSELKLALMRAQKAGVLVITAAGNDAIDQDSDKNPVFPAAYASELDNIVVVAAVDSANELATFSNWGANSVHIAAPGVKIFSTTAQSPSDEDPEIYNDVIVTYQATTSQNFEIDWNGTSMAAPFVAGAAALVWSKYPDENYLQIKNRILDAAKPVATLRGKVSTGGVLDVSASLGLNSH